MVFFVAVVAAIIVTVAHPAAIGQTVFIPAQKSFATFAYVQAADPLVAAVHALIDAIAYHFHRQTQSIIQARKLFCGAIKLLVVWHIVMAIAFVIIFRTIEVTVAA